MVQTNHVKRKMLMAILLSQRKTVSTTLKEFKHKNFSSLQQYCVVFFKDESYSRWS